MAVAAGLLEMPNETVTSFSVCRVICNGSTAKLWPLSLVLATARHVLVTEAMVENKKEHLLQVRENADDLCFHAHIFSAFVCVSDGGHG